MIRFFLSLFLALPLMAETLNGIAVLVKDKPITLYDIEEAAPEYGHNIQQTVDALIRKKLEAIEVEERGLRVSKQEIHEEVARIAEQNGVSVSKFYEGLYASQKMTQSAFKAQVEERLLNQKLFGAIAFSHIEEPTEAEIEEYYKLNISKYTHAQRYDVVVYSSPSKSALAEKIGNPMFYAPEVASEEQTLHYGSINPRLSELLEATENGTFTQIIPMQGRFLSFLVRQKHEVTTQPLDKLGNQIVNEIMGQKRQQVLNDYFARLRLNADIRVIRLPQ